MTNVMKRVAGLAVAAAATGGLLVTAPAAAHAGTAAGVRPAGVPRVCPSGNVEIHFSNGAPDSCYGGARQILPLNVCSVSWISTGSNWVAIWWSLPWENQYQPGMGPGSVWTPGLPVCVQQIAINT